MNPASDIWYYFIKGNRLQTLQEYDQSIVFSTRSLKYQQDRNIYLNLAIIHYQKQDYCKAAKNYAITSALKPDCTMIHNSWGLCLFHLEKYDEAISKFQIAVEINPKYTLGYLNWGLCLYWKKEESKAEQIIEEGLRDSFLKKKALLERYESELLIVEKRLANEMNEETKEFLKGRAQGYRWMLELISEKVENILDPEDIWS